MNTIEATYRIVTPMFIGGANSDPSDGIRPPSFKGALRFWWRALNWGRYPDLAALHQKEAELFGSAAKTVNREQAGGQGVFLLTINEVEHRQTLNDWPKANTGAGYLAYGILESKGGKRGVPVPHKVGIKEGLKFTVTVVFRPNVTEEQQESVTEAMDVIGLLGGLGSRSRRGYGSITKEYDGRLPAINSFCERVDNLLLSQVQEAPFTTINQGTMFKILNPCNDARNALEKAGRQYKDYRKSIVNQRNNRIAFGLPLQGVDEQTRRASPLFFHIQAVEGGEFVPVVYTMPALNFHHIDEYQRITHESVDEFMGRLI